MIIEALETAGLLACLATLLIAGRSFARPRVLRVTLFSLVSLLAVGHVANVLEIRGLVWADTLADQFSILVPVVWGLFLLETGRAYLSARLQASDEKVRFFLEDVPAAVAWLDGDTRLLGYSRAWAQAHPASAKGAPLGSVLPVPLPQLTAAVARCLRAETPGLTAPIEEATQVRDSTHRYFRWSIRGWAHPDHVALGALVILEEITDQQEAEAQRVAAGDELARLQRLAHVGQMAAGAAHDFNNFMQLIHAALYDLEAEPRHAEVLENVRRVLDSAREMTRSMLRFGGGQDTPLEAINLVSLLRSMQRPLSYALGRLHHLDVVLPEAAVTIEGRASRLQQALLNLAVNARDAMPRGGSIQIALAVEGNQAVLSVRDTGTGMSDAVRSQVFKPFFTTKGLQGSGLGLPIVQSVVEEHHGQISLESQLEHGSTFHLRLPLAAPPNAPSQAQAKAQAHSN